MSETAVLKIKVDSSGAVAGATAAASSLDRVTAAATRSAAATVSGSAAFNSYKGNASQVVNSLQAMLREQSGLARAYALGAEAVEKYNLQLKIENVLTEAGVAADSVRGRVIANQVTQLEALRVANERAAVAARELAMAQEMAIREDIARSTAVAGSGLQGMAMKALGATMAVGFLVGVLKDYAGAAMEAEESTRRLTDAVTRKGAAFKIAATGLETMAEELQGLTGFMDDDIMKAQSILLRFESIDSTNIERVTKATLDFAAATGQDAASAATALGKAMLEPGEGMRALKEVGISLTQQQQDLIDMWNKHGQSAKSVDLILEKLNRTIGDESVRSAQTSSGQLRVLAADYDNLKESAGGALLNILRGIGRVYEAWSSPAAANARNAIAAITAEAEKLALAERKAAIEAENAAAKLNQFNSVSAGYVAGFGAALDSLVERSLAEAEAAAEAFANSLQAVLDELDPVAAEVRGLEQRISLVSTALASGGPNVDRYREALELLRKKLAEVKSEATLVAETIPLIEMGRREAPALGQGLTGGSITYGQSPYVVEMMRAGEQFSANLTEGMGQAAASFGREFIETGEINVQRLGDMLLDTLLSAAQQYFATMVANQAKLEATSNTGGGANAGAAMGFAAAFLLVAKAIADNGNEKKAKSYDENAFFGRYYTGGMSGGNAQSDYTFRDSRFEAGNTHDQDQMVQTVRAYLEAFREVTGNVVTDIGEFAIEIRHDGEAFRTTYAGVVLGEFETIADATLAGIQAAFKAGDFTGALSPMFEQMLTNFKGSAEDLLAGFEFVKGIEADLSGLSEIEVALQDLPGKTAQLSTKLQELGISMADSQVIAAQWAATQYQSLRDQITGHQQSEAEQLAQKQREAALFNAQLALDEAKIRAEMANLQNQQIIEQAKVDVAQAGAQAQLEIINATLTAYGQVLAAIQSVAPIDIGEIRLPGGGGRQRGGGRVSSGPSEAEQRASAFLDFLERLELDGLSGYQRALTDLNAAFAEHTQAAAEMEGGEERLAAARRQALADLREDVIDAFGSPMEGLRDRLEEIRQQVGDWYAANNELGAQFQRGEISLQQLLDALAEANVLWAEFGDMARSELLNLALYFTDALGDTEESARIREELAEMEWDFKRLEMQMLIETYEEIGWITAAAADHWRGVLAAIPENRPGNINDTTTGGGSGSLQSAIARLRNAIEALRESNENLLLSDASPLSTADQFAEAQRLYNETLAAAQGGDLQAIEDFASVRDQYLALAAAMYGTAGGGYQSIFQQSLQAGQDLATAGQAILDAIPPQMAGVEERLDTIAEILAAIEAAQAPVVNPPGSGDGPPTPPGHPLPPRPPHWPGEGDPVPGGGPMGHPPRPGDSQGFAGSGETVSQLRAMNEQLRQLLAATEEQTRSANSNSLRRVATVGGGRGISVRRGN